MPPPACMHTYMHIYIYTITIYIHTYHRYVSIGLAPAPPAQQAAHVTALAMRQEPPLLAMASRAEEELEADLRSGRDVCPSFFDVFGSKRERC